MSLVPYGCEGAAMGAKGDVANERQLGRKINQLIRIGLVGVDIVDLLDLDKLYILFIRALEILIKVK